MAQRGRRTRCAQVRSPLIDRVPEPTPALPAPPVFTVVIPARNEAARIAATVARVRQVAADEGLPTEVVVVANACRDGTGDVAAHAGARVVEVERPGVGHARNLGAAEAGGEVLVFLDADTMPGDGFLTAVIRAVRGGCIGGSCDTVPLEPTIRGHVFWFWYNRVSRRLLKTNGVAFYTRSVFHALKGYREDLTEGEDTELHSRAKSIGRIVHLVGTHVSTSMRRFEAEGYLRTIVRWELSFFVRQTNETYREVRP